MHINIGHKCRGTLVLILAMCLAACQSEPNMQSPIPASTPSASSADPSGAVVVKEITPFYRIDLSDQRRLAGAVDNIFVGKVRNQQNTVLRNANVAYTRFNVDLILNLKGAAPGILVVEQQGGFDSKANTRYIVKGDRPLAVGGTYIFAALHRKIENTYNVINIYGDIPVNDAESTTITSEHPPAAVTNMRNSIANQIPS